ncbi:MAG: lipopolysaccharide transport periplasmic protein LptA [Burkholderiales bacterium]|nr:lipopolysaccharide transport periplasmic protein LptA [Burkholderiales bacterium]
MTRQPGPLSRHVAACVASLAIVCAPDAHAERADRYKPTNVESDRMNYDDLKQVNVFTGSVVLTRGTITMRGDRLVLQQDAEGYQYGTANGRLASFRQKRDGIDEWVEGYGEEVHYDGKTERLRFTGRAKVRRLEGTRVVDEIEGAVIVYDSRTEQYEVEGGTAAGPAVTGGRVRVVIQPRLGDGAAAAPAPSPGGAARPGAGPAVAPRPAEPR